MAKPLKLSLEERKIIEKFKDHFSANQIAKRLNRGKNTVVVELRRGGGKEAYTAKKGQAYQIKAEKRRIEKITNRNISDSLNRHKSSARNKIELLEMQIEILFDEIKKMKENMNAAK